MCIKIVTIAIVIIGPGQRNAANAVFASWIAEGNILGILAVANGN